MPKPRLWMMGPMTDDRSKIWAVEDVVFFANFWGRVLASGGQRNVSEEKSEAFCSLVESWSLIRLYDLCRISTGRYNTGFDFFPATTIQTTQKGNPRGYEQRTEQHQHQQQQVDALSRRFVICDCQSVSNRSSSTTYPLFTPNQSYRHIKNTSEVRSKLLYASGGLV